MEKINFANNQAPYIEADNLNLMQDNIENAINNEVILFEGKLLGGQTKSIDFSPYKRLLITYGLYDVSTQVSNNGGTSGIAILDLSTNINQMYSVCGQVPYNIFSTKIESEMGYGFKVNKTKNEFQCKFLFGNEFQTNELYYVSKIVGIK